MAASKSIREALNTLNDELLTAKLTAAAFNNLHADIEASPPPLHDPHAWVFVVVYRWSTAWNGRPSAGSTSATKRHCQCLKTWKTSPGRSKPGLGNLVSPARGVAEGGVPDRATLDNQRSDGRRPPLFRVHCTLCRSPYPAAPSRLELFCRLTPPFSLISSKY
jgi:hypothetical protein